MICYCFRFHMKTRNLIGVIVIVLYFQVEINDDDNEPTQIPTLVSGSHLSLEKEKKLVTVIQPTATLGTSKKKIPKALKLSEVTKPLTQEERQRHMAAAVKRILQTNQCLNAAKIKLICSVAASSTFELRYSKLATFVTSVYKNCAV